nr:TetR/AcrR family transcriptional regulator [Rhodococcus sp. (in: high G+C Gram-positive bacteria)]
MTDRASAPTSRDKILDAAYTVMSEQGLIAATTKKIATKAGYSEATIYKLFADKVDLFLAVLDERLPVLDVDSSTDVDSSPQQVTSADVESRLAELCGRLTDFYSRSFPIAAALFADPALLAHHRRALEARDRGPRRVLEFVRSTIEKEQTAGHIAADVHVGAVTEMMVGACFQHAFFEVFHGSDESPTERAAFAKGLAAATLRALRSA